MLNFKLLILLILVISVNLSAQESYFTHSNSDLIKTILVYSNDDPLSYPTISVGSDEFITIVFDELSESEKNFKYTLVHCNSDWRASDLLPSEYVRGFKSSFIDNYEYSFNTNIPYVNYHLRIPNDHTRLKVSGNYAVIITTEDSDETLAVACFRVVDEQIIVETELTFTTEKTINKHHQQLNFTLHHPSLTVNDPNSEIKVFIQQNNRRDNIKSNLKPYHIEPGRIEYRQSSDLVFEGGNEFRYF